jgi:hypothetical protein
MQGILSWWSLSFKILSSYFVLKTRVKSEPTETMSKPTGVPPHVMQLNLTTSLHELCQSTLLQVNEQSTLVRQTLFDAMEERAVENGQISRHQIITLLDDFCNGIRDDVCEQLNVIRQGQACLQLFCPTVLLPMVTM